MATCPYCQAEVRTETVDILHAKNTVIYKGETARLTKKEMAMLSALADAMPNTRNTDQLMNRMYEPHEDEPFPDVIGVFMWKVRQKLKPLGIKIDNQRGRGWYLSGYTIRNIKIGADTDGHDIS